MAAEIYFAKFVAEHNLPFLIAYHFSRLTKVMFPNSKIETQLETQSRSCLTPATTCDLLTVKMNHDPACYSSQDLITDKLLQEARSATWCSLQKTQIL